ncbi:MAG: PIN domain-containing protein [Candidatus Alcyoniella australis]|nr:PIN domain-containing protein [Candidatus Alcyoniella australis]
MSEVLIDTSAWIAALRGSERRIQRAVDGLLESDRALFCGVVEMELLHGLRPRERKTLLPLFEALPYVQLDREDWRSVGKLRGELRAKGKIIPATDALIAALCLRLGVQLLSLDKHFDRLPQLRRYKTL